MLIQRILTALAVALCCCCSPQTATSPTQPATTKPAPKTSSANSSATAGSNTTAPPSSAATETPDKATDAPNKAAEPTQDPGAKADAASGSTKTDEEDPFEPPTAEQEALIDAATKALRDDNAAVAITAFEALVRTEPLSGLKMTGVIALADFYMQGGEAARAVELLEGVLDKAPKTGEAQFVLARAYKESGKPRDAIQAYRVALQVEPLLLRAYVEIGGLQAELGDDETAQKSMLAYERAVYRYAKLLEAEDTHPSDKFKIIEAFSMLPDDRVMNALVLALDDPFRIIRLASAEALGEVGTREVLPALRTSLDKARAADDQHMMGLVEQAIKRVESSAPANAKEGSKEEGVGPVFTKPGETPTEKPPIEVNVPPAGDGPSKEGASPSKKGNAAPDKETAPNAPQETKPQETTLPKQ
ncbi:MAG: tetratricopeptide repeat protein [Myxococcota bacterium]